jgi:putative PIN family toxin of toxin-antitoxin system
VFDANTVVSAALSPDGTARRALLYARSSGQIALSDAVLEEIIQVLGRPKFSRILSQSRVTDTLELLTAAAVWVEPANQVTDCRDAKDNRYLELATAAGAQTIVSGDKDLLVLNPWRGISVQTPATFLASFVQQ